MATDIIPKINPNRLPAAPSPDHPPTSALLAVDRVLWYQGAARAVDRPGHRHYSKYMYINYL